MTRDEAKRRIAATLEAKRARRSAPPVPAPRFDAVFFEGVAWLDSLACESPPPVNPNKT